MKKIEKTKEQQTPESGADLREEGGGGVGSIKSFLFAQNKVPTCCAKKIKQLLYFRIKNWLLNLLLFRSP